MGIFRNVRERWKLILSLSVQFVIPGITVHLLRSLHLGSGSKLINSKCFTNIFCKPRLFLFILPITLTCIGKKKSVTGAKTWAINMLMNSFSCLFLFIRGGCDGPWYSGHSSQSPGPCHYQPSWQYFLSSGPRSHLRPHHFQLKCHHQPMGGALSKPITQQQGHLQMRLHGSFRISKVSQCSSVTPGTCCPEHSIQVFSSSP